MIRDRVINASCFDVLPEIPDKSIQLVLTDPPYVFSLSSSTGKKKAERSLSGYIENMAFFFSQIARESKRILLPSGFLLCFCNWQSLPSVSKGFAISEMPITDVVVWDKEWIGVGWNKAFRARHELIAVSAMPNAVIRDRRASNIVNYKWQAVHSGKTGHPTEKPVELLKHFIKHCSNEGELVLDPFAGSGSTLVAAQAENRHFLGIEIEEKWCSVAKERLNISDCK